MRDGGFSQIWLAAIGAAAGAVVGAGAWLAIFLPRLQAAADQDDALLLQASQMAQVIGAAIRGAMWGAVIGVGLAGLYMWWCSRDVGGDQRAPGDGRRRRERW